MSSSPSPSSSASPPTSTASPPSPSSPPASGVPPPPQIPSPAPPLPSPPPPEATSPPSGTAPSPPVPSRSPPPAASPPPPFTVAPPPPPPSVPTTPNAPPPFPPSPPPPASQPPQSRPPPTGSPPPRSSPSRLPHSPASSSPPWLPLPSPPRNSSVTPNPPSLSPPSTVTPGGPRNSSSPEHGSGLKTGSFVAIGVVAALIAFRLVVLAVCVIKKRRKAVAEYNAGLVIPSPPASSMSAILRSQTGPLVQRQNPESTSRINSLPETPRAGTTPSFSYEELYRITNGFSPDNILGEGGFGSVYKGCLHNGREVAVKRLKIESKQGDREFKAEVEIISRVHHRHLVSLVGYCVSDNQRLLVYDFVPNGTLESHLHGNKRPAMDWATRVTVAAGAARGIAYLHEDCNPKIIHRDIKSSNILLDNNFEAQVSDFGLARLALELDGQTHVTTRVMGTFGYLAPEYASSGKLTEKSDVFSFGVVLLELITGQKPVDNTKPFGDESLVVWARPLLSHALATGELGELPDDRLQKNFNIREMLRMIEVAAACVRHSASMRPQMGKVVRVLDSFADIDLTSGVTPGQSEAFNVVNSANIRIFQQLALGNPGSTSDYALSDWSHQKDA